MPSWKLYVVVRRDLSKSQQAVQGGHAIAEWCRTFPEWQNETLVMLSALDLDHLIQIERALGSVPHVIFREPDIGNEETALATLHHLEDFKSMRLL